MSGYYAMYYTTEDFEVLVGHTLVSIEGAEQDSEEITFIAEDGTQWKLYHHQECCENVTVEDVCGDIEYLLDSPITQAEETSSADENADESGMWTFYRISTMRGNVVIRWYGSSTGHYSERVTFARVKTEDREQ